MPETLSVCTSEATLDVGQTLDLIESVIARITAGQARGEPGTIVSDCLQLAGVDRSIAGGVQRHRVRMLYASQSMPIRVTLGAAVALDAAQRSEWLGLPNEEVLANAIRMSSRLPSMISGRVWKRLGLSIEPNA
jgi:hypothetical protein